MKYLLLTCCLLLANATYAQKKAPAPAVATAPVQYCTLIAEGHRFNKVELKLDYGQDSKAQAQDATLAEAEVQLRELNSVAAALNYLHRLGWEYIGVSQMESVATLSGPNSVIGYLLRRRP